MAQARPQWQITAIDCSAKALDVAQRNAVLNDVQQVAFLQSDWFSALQGQRFDVIVSNPPYIAEHDPHLSALKFEPLNALVSGEDGLDAIGLLMRQVALHLTPGGCFIVEHGYDQAQRVADLAVAAGFVNVNKHTDLSSVDRFVTAFSSS